MSPAAALPMADQRRFGAREIAWWAGAAALVLMAHAAVGYAMQSWRPAEPDGGPPQAQVIELSPIALTPAEPAPISDEIAPDQPDPAEEPETVETEPPPEPPVEQAEPVAEPSEAAPVDTVEPTPPTVAERVDQPPLEEVVPEIAEAITPEVVIPLPQPKPVDAPVETKPKKQAKAEVKEPAEVKAKKPVKEAKKRPKKEKAAPPRTTASVAATSAARAAAPKSAKAAAARRGDAKKWNSQLTRWLNRHKRYPKAAKARRSEGTVSVSFMVAGSGRVTSVRITGSSGDPDLDRSVLDLLQGATVPAPPEGVSSRVNVPLRFDLRN
ncbi:energy transducer TonB [Mesorhizobium sp.]|uniref:energy transducer TonB n=1 Tax=Mesorhizobium sp. TaxID=1871066 RepID=UPI000FE83085|nr:energy transducer TonB [Mesorhizobium sp.]RWP40804.1 MAG: energy transducer TonB [Mesorhizobium sp.]RWP58531.1 MAG: energy transducer TonB [Mesorhizobium sp.]TIM63396.1 MAG: energy transducer TonB [Mesorhizobium sp.]